MRRRGARESRKKKKPNKSRGNGMESYLSSPPLSLSAHKRFQLLLFLFLQKKKSKKSLLAYRYTARNNQITTFGYVSGTNQITALRYACANQSVRVSSFMPIIS